MPKLIDATGVTLENPWVLQPRTATLDEVLAADASAILVNAQLWTEHRDILLQLGKDVAVWLDSDQDPEQLAADLAHLSLIALNFPGFMDGRSYSAATMLRQQYKYSGELRAIGDVLRDQLFFLKRCGFTTFDLKDSVKLEDAKTAFIDFRDSYQSTVEQPQPLFRRRG